MAVYLQLGAIEYLFSLAWFHDEKANPNQNTMQ
jgi:hypothetical protein